MILAQSFLEYGAIGSLIGELERVASSVPRWLRNAGPETWMVISVITIVMLWLFSLPRSRQ